MIIPTRRGIYYFQKNIFFYKKNFLPVSGTVVESSCTSVPHLGSQIKSMQIKTDHVHVMHPPCHSSKLSLASILIDHHYDLQVKLNVGDVVAGVH